MLVTFDPGIHAAGVAVFDGGELAGAWLVQAKYWNQMGPTAAKSILCRFPAATITRVISEVPQVYVGRHQKGRQKDLVDLAVVAGMFLGSFQFLLTGCATDEIEKVEPKAWKRQVPKEIMIERIKGRLSKEEMLRVEIPRAKSLDHNIFDSVGLGLWAAKRL